VNKKEVHTIHLTKDQISLYLNGDLSDKEMHVIERHLLSCEFCNEAIEGYENTMATMDIDLAMDDIQSRLDSRVAKEKRNTKITFYKIAAIALVLIISGIFITNYFIGDIKKPQFSEKKQEQTTDSSNVKKQELEKPTKKEIESTEIKEEIEPQLEKEEENSAEEQEKSIEKKSESLVIPSTNTLSGNSNSEYATTENVQFSNATEEVTSDEIEIAAYEVPLTDEDDLDLDAITIQSSAKRERSSVQARSMKSAQSEIVDEVKDEKIKIQGVVRDEESNEVLPFVSVVNLDKDLGTQTDLDGEFELEAEEGDEIVVSYIGYNTQSIEVADEQEVTIAMNAGVDLDEFVVSTISTEKTSDADPIPLIGYKAYKSYLKENLQFPQAAIDAGINGKVVVKFSVDEKGNMHDFTIVKGLGYGCDEEAIRLIKEGPIWQSAIRNGQAINRELKMKVSFK